MKTSNTTEESMKIRIKSNIQNSISHTKDVTLLIPPSYTVHQLKEHVRSSCFNDTANNGNDTSNGNDDGMNHITSTTTAISKDRYLRLICSGRLLAPDSIKISEFKCLKDGSVIHAVLAAPGIRGGQQAALSRESSTDRNSRPIRFRGIGIGSNGLVLPLNNDDDDDDDDAGGGDIEEGRQRIGFDRLRANGMSREEILAVRTYFSRHVDTFIEQRNQLSSNNDNNNSTNNNNSSSSSSISGNNATIVNIPNNNNNEDPRILRLRMEDEWMNTQGPYSEFRLNTNTSSQSSNTSNAQRRTRAYINGLEIDATTREITRDFRGQTGSSVIGALGTNRDLVWGFVLGYSFGFMTMFIIWLPTVPHKQRVGILSGFCFHMCQRILEHKE